MNTNNLSIALLALFLGALGLYLYSLGQTGLGVGILIATLVGTVVLTQVKKNAPAPKKNKKKRKR